MQVHLSEVLTLQNIMLILVQECMNMEKQEDQISLSVLVKKSESHTLIIS
jgi:hypothetical protein